MMEKAENERIPLTCNREGMDGFEDAGGKSAITEHHCSHSLVSSSRDSVLEQIYEMGMYFPQKSYSSLT